MNFVGGRIRGQGTYGCVFQPKLKCKGSNSTDKRNKSVVGKITMPQDAENELMIASYLESIPDAKHYTVIANSKSCIPQPKSKQDEPDLEICQFISDTPITQTVQIEMPWGGYPLSRLNLHPDSFDFVHFTEQLLAIGSFLIINRLCHFDLYGQNFLFDKDTVPRLIDFGFAFKTDEITSEILNSRWREIAVDHDTETPEVTLMLGAIQHIAPMDLIEGMKQTKPAVIRLASLCEVKPSDWANDLSVWTSESRSFQQQDWVSCWKLYWPGFDAWGIGAVLLQILEVQMTIQSFQKDVKWIQSSTKLKKLLRGLCHAHPAYRLDALEALDLLTDGSHAFVAAGSYGAAWISEKKRIRSLHFV